MPLANPLKYRGNHVSSFRTGKHWSFCCRGCAVDCSGFPHWKLIGSSNLSRQINPFLAADVSRSVPRAGSLQLPCPKVSAAQLGAMAAVRLFLPAQALPQPLRSDLRRDAATPRPDDIFPGGLAAVDCARAGSGTDQFGSKGSAGGACAMHRCQSCPST